MPTNEKMTSGFDLSYPLISRPTQDSKKVSAKVEAAPHEPMTSGFDLRWPLICQRPEDLHVEGVPAKKAA
jgi:hypothetical protein